MRTLLTALLILTTTLAMSQGIGIQQPDRMINEEVIVFNDSIWSRQGWITFGTTADVNVYRGAVGLLKTDDDFQADRIGIATSPVELFDAAGTLSGDYLRYNGSELNIRLTTTLPTPGAAFQLYDGAGTALSSLIIDELGSGGFTVRNISGQEVVKINGSINEGHSFFNQEYFSVGRNGVTPTYGGTLAGAMVTFNNSRFDRNANTGLNNPNNYQVVVEDEDADSDWLGLGWTSGGTGTYEDNIGAAIVFEPVGAFSQGNLNFYQKTSTSDAVAPDLVMQLTEGAVRLNLGAAGTSDSLLVANGDGNVEWKTMPLDGGTYAPTLTIVTNISALTAAGRFHYQRIDSTVVVTGEITVDAIVSGSTSFTIDLPIASDFTDAAEDAYGYAGGIATATGKQFPADADVAGDVVSFTAAINNTAAIVYPIWFSYIVK